MLSIAKTLFFEVISDDDTIKVNISLCFFMQKIATRVFIYASVAFGLIGIAMILVGPFGPDQPYTPLQEIFGRLLTATVFVILPSFALSVAGKYLDGKS